MSRSLGIWASVRGLTVAEAIGVVGMLSVVMAFAFPSAAEMLRIYRLRGAALNVASALQHVRILSVKENNRYHFVVLPSGTSFAVHDDDDNDGTLDAGEDRSVTSIANEYPGLVMSTNVERITFAPNGFAPNSGEVTLTDQQGSVKVLLVSDAGRIRVE